MLARNPRMIFVGERDPRKHGVPFPSARRRGAGGEVCGILVKSPGYRDFIMHHSELRASLRKQPFQPFRMVLSSGNTYDIRSPEWILVTGMTTYVGIPGEAGDGEILRHLDNAHIVEVIPLPEGATSKSA